MDRLDGVRLLCGFVQIIGLVIQLAAEAVIPVIMALMGFAAIVIYLLPKKSSNRWEHPLYTMAALCGLALIFFALAAAF